MKDMEKQKATSRESATTSVGVRPINSSRTKDNDGIITEDKEVIIIGNGPSGICLSYMLSGHWPYYSGAKHPDPQFQHRLEQCCTDGRSLLEQDLEVLTNGLEGRSSNQMALLFDAMANPNADFGADVPSLLRWEDRQDREISHVVLGKTAEGGAWQTMNGKVQTLSRDNWMQLPDLPFTKWRQDKASKENCSRPLIGGQGQRRATMKEVKDYYEDYVKAKNLTQYFRNFFTVKSMVKVCQVHDHVPNVESGERSPCRRSGGQRCRYLWEVRGVRRSATKVASHKQYTAGDEPFCYRAPCVVLATGARDVPNRLRLDQVETPPTSSCQLVYSLSEFEKCLQHQQEQNVTGRVLIVGAGLSAADAILFARARLLPVIHVYRQNSHAFHTNLPLQLYPEYHEIYSLMRRSKSATNLNTDWYLSYPDHEVKAIHEDGTVILRYQNSGLETAIQQVTQCVALIGSKSDLSFLQSTVAKNLGVIPGKPIDSKHNPIDVDSYTFQTALDPSLYAMGPLIGDNFVRFLQGAALGIISHLWAKKTEAL